MKLFLQKKCKIFDRWGLRTQTPVASGGYGLCTQIPSLRRLGASPPDPHWPPAAGGSAPRPPTHSPPLQISGYAPGSFILQYLCTQKVPLSKNFDHVIACDLWFGSPQSKILATLMSSVILKLKGNGTTFLAMRTTKIHE